MAPWLMLGFLVSGLLKVFIPQEKIIGHLGSNGLSSIIKATLFGIPLPLCSCGVIPTAISLKQNGASKSATNAFLIATPQTGIDSIFATYSLLGLAFAITRPIVALFTGVFGGYLTSLAEKEDEAIKVKAAQSAIPIQNKWMEVLRYGFLEMVQDIAKWLIVGLIIAALITTFVPTNFFTETVDNYYLQMALVVLVSIPMYVCATGSIPIAVALLAKGLAPGIVMLFLMAGPATNSATLSVLFNSMGKKSTFVYLFAIFLGATVSALLIDFVLYDFFSDTYLNLNISKHQHHANNIFGIFMAIGLVLILTFAIIQPYLSSKSNQNMSQRPTQPIKVNGMTCNHCKASVEKNVLAISGVESVLATPNKNLVEISGDYNLDEVKSKIKELGFEVEQ